MNITCPTCKTPHVLFWYVDAKGRRQLSYLCNRVTKLRQGKTPIIGTAIVPCLDETTACQSVPEKWSAGWAKKQAGKQQFQLVMTNQTTKKP